MDSARVQMIRYVEELQGQLHQTALQLDQLLAACSNHGKSCFYWTAN